MKKSLQTLSVLVLTGAVTCTVSAQQRDTLREKQIQEVVVTALGIKRDQKALGYAAEKKDSAVFEKAQYNNWSTALEGKVAGLKVQTAAAGPLETARIKLRGETSMVNSDNSALIVLDGVPIEQKSVGTGSAAYGAGSGGDLPVDYGNVLNSINPEDIESVTVLKGASAAALYGERGANGAIMITTKSGSNRNGKLQISYNSNTSFDSVLKWPDWQYEYGQGANSADPSKAYYSYGASPDGVNTGSTSSAFGPKFNGQYFFQYDPTVEGQSLERQLWRPYKDNIKGFFQIGSTYSNSVTLENGWKKFNVRSSFNYTKNEWIVPNSGFDRFSTNNSLNFKLNDKFRAALKFTYANTTSDNLPATGYNNQSLNYFMIFQNPNVDLAWYRPIWKRDKYQTEQIHPFSSYIDNPYLIAYEMTNAINKNNLVGGLTLNYTLNPHWDLMLRSGIEYTEEDRNQRRPWNSANYAKGFYSEQHIVTRDLNNDFLVSYKTDFGKFDIKASAGASMRDYRRRLNRKSAIGLIVPGNYSFENALSLFEKPTTPYDIKTNSVYGMLNLAYNDMVFVDVTARNDWSSTLPKENWSFFYPSVSTSIILSKMLNLPREINLLKLRASFAKAGFGTNPYQLEKYYTPSEYPDSYVMDNNLYNANLKPKFNTNYEGGLDINMLRNRLNFNFTYYHNYTKNEVFAIPVLIETGYSRKYINSGLVRNQGIEIATDFWPIKKKDYSWKVSANWAKNKNRVIEVPEEFQNDPAGYNYANAGGAVYFNAVKGGALGDMYGYKLMRDPQGNVIYGSDGLTAKPTVMEKVGNAFPLWRAGIENSFKIKNFGISFSFDGQYKGLVYSQTHHKMTEQGKLSHTLRYRDSPNGQMVGEGVVQNADGTFSPNTTPILVSKWYADYYRRANVETNSFDASFIKLRDARISYSFPKDIVRSMRVQDMSIALFGKNLWMWTKDFPIFDPEAATLDDADITPGIDMGALPSTKTIGIGFNVKF